MIYYLNDIWSIYFHDPLDNNWTDISYKLISTISSINEFVDVFNGFNELFNKGMFFIMREHIMPRWEDENNKYGGCFSYKISKSNLYENFFDILSQLLGETIGKKDEYSKNINGISISPKKNYYIIRIWIKDNAMANKDYYNITIPKYSTLLYKNYLEE